MSLVYPTKSVFFSQLTNWRFKYHILYALFSDHDEYKFELKNCGFHIERKMKKLHSLRNHQRRYIFIYIYILSRVISLAECHGCVGVRDGRWGKNKKRLKGKRENCIKNGVKCIKIEVTGTSAILDSRCAI